MKTTLYTILLMCIAAKLKSQISYDFASTGQQKLLINPSFCADAGGLNVQSLSAFQRAVFTNYTSAGYAGKNFGFGISNTSFSERFNFTEDKIRYISNQTDISFACRFRLCSKVTLIPSLQGSVFSGKMKPDGFTTSFDNKSATLSSGLLVDINKNFTFGVAAYNIRESHSGYLRFLRPVMVCHASASLLKDKPVHFQPYLVLKTSRYYGYMEAGTYTLYKLFTLQTAIRFGDTYNDRLTAGLHVRLNRVKLGYTFSKFTHYASLKRSVYHELLLSATLSKDYNPSQSSLMLN